MSKDLITFPTKKIHALCRQYGVKELSVFGSVLRNDFSTDSDVDLLIEFKHETQIGFVALSKLQRELSALLGRKVDLVPKKGLKPIIRQKVLDSAKVIYEE